jgi:hypothetical protein
MRKVVVFFSIFQYFSFLSYKISTKLIGSQGREDATGSIQNALQYYKTSLAPIISTLITVFVLESSYIQKAKTPIRKTRYTED